MNLVTQIINILLTLVSKDQYKEIVDKLIDSVEDAVAKSPNTIDDAIILPLCDKVRDVLDVPDND